MKVAEVVEQARDVITVKRVYAEPFEKDGLTVIPAAKVSGGAGAGGGHDEKGQEGEGGGIALNGRPAGAYVIKDGHVRWQPAVDVNRLFTVVGAVLVAFLLSRPRLVRARGRALSRAQSRAQSQAQSRGALSRRGRRPAAAPTRGG